MRELSPIAFLLPLKLVHLLVTTAFNASFSLNVVLGVFPVVTVISSSPLPTTLRIKKPVRNAGLC